MAIEIKNNTKLKVYEIEYPIDDVFTIGEFIYKHRIAQNITQEDLAIISELKQPQISRIEKNKNVKISTLYKVLNSLGLRIVSTESPIYYYDEKGNLLIGSLIAYKRKINHMTQHDLSNKTSLKQPQIVQIEKNNDITISTLSKILKELDLKLKIINL